MAGCYLRDSLIKRPKQGFGFPLARWMRGELRPLLQEMVRSFRSSKADCFRGTTWRAWSRSTSVGSGTHKFRLWFLLNLEVWHRLFPEGESRDDVVVWIQEPRFGLAAV